MSPGSKVRKARCWISPQPGVSCLAKPCWGPGRGAQLGGDAAGVCQAPAAEPKRGLSDSPRLQSHDEEVDAVF
eukprot:8637667-Pyramimonas_sp.AAC.1